MSDLLECNATVANGVRTTDLLLSVPLRHGGGGDAARITLFARRLVDASALDGGLLRPYLLYLQGGPGCPSPRSVSAWVRAALKKYQVGVVAQGVAASTPAAANPASAPAPAAGHLAGPARYGAVLAAHGSDCRGAAALPRRLHRARR